MSEEIKHKQLISEKGPFIIDCNLKIFTDEEIQILKKYGHWFHALTHGDLNPFTLAQARFIKVAQNEETPVTVEEKAWFKYLGRKRIEADLGDRLHVHYEIDQDSFYNRDQAKQLRSTMGKVIYKTHNMD
ncbi:MAG: DUF413 domain-containing protein [Cyclobacteriaceae bacterium]|jgi:hypothetical protein|nr:DUF413 domain-containing protein [Cyclobacteriaceae bacterium]